MVYKDANCVATNALKTVYFNNKIFTEVYNKNFSRTINLIVLFPKCLDFFFRYNTESQLGTSSPLLIVRNCNVSSLVKHDSSKCQHKEHSYMILGKPHNYSLIHKSLNITVSTLEHLLPPVIKKY